MTKWIMIIDDTDEKENKLELRKNDDGSFYARFMTYTGNYIDFPIKPIRGPAMVVMPNGDSAYITQGHIDAMLEYERVQHIKEIYDRMNHSLDGMNEADLPKHIPLVTQETPVWTHTKYLNYVTCVNCPKCNAIIYNPEFNKTCNYCGAKLKEAGDG